MAKAALSDDTDQSISAICDPCYMPDHSQKSAMFSLSSKMFKEKITAKYLHKFSKYLAYTRRDTHTKATSHISSVADTKLQGQ